MSGADSSVETVWVMAWNYGASCIIVDGPAPLKVQRAAHRFWARGKLATPAGLALDGFRKKCQTGKPTAVTVSCSWVRRRRQLTSGISFGFSQGWRSHLEKENWNPCSFRVLVASQQSKWETQMPFRRISMMPRTVVLFCIENDASFLQRLLQERLYHTQRKYAPFIRSSRTA